MTPENFTENFNPDFYPTPLNLAVKMAGKIKEYPNKPLDPQAGKGDLVEAVRKRFDRYGSNMNFSAIEIDPNLRAILRSKNISVIDSNFLEFAGPDKFDLIIMNPPFKDGDKHLLKAIDILYRGQIICLLNAETLENPFSNIRKDLARKLKELNAEIEYLDGAFENAERKTNVRCALVNICIERNIESDLFGKVVDVAVDSNERIKEKYEVSTKDTILDMVNQYKETVNISTETIIGYYKNYNKVGKYIGLNAEVYSKQYSTRSSSDLTNLVQNTLNSTLQIIRQDYWRKALELKEIKDRLTEARRKEFEHEIELRKSMDFTENNIRNFILKLIVTYNDTLMKAVLEVFDKFTVRHSWDDGLDNDNIYLFNGWKTNKAFKVKEKVVLPLYGNSYGGGPFRGYKGWALDYSVKDQLHDIDKVMAFFDDKNYKQSEEDWREGNKEEFHSIVDSINNSFSKEISTKIESTYFICTCYKKGTIHLKFKDMDILRRFNVAASQGKGWLPNGYGERPYGDFAEEEKLVVESFEGKKSYEKCLGQKVFQKSVNNVLLLA